MILTARNDCHTNSKHRLPFFMIHSTMAWKIRSPASGNQRVIYVFHPASCQNDFSLNKHPDPWLRSYPPIRWMWYSPGEYVPFIVPLSRLPPCQRLTWYRIHLDTEYTIRPKRQWEGIDNIWQKSLKFWCMMSLVLVICPWNARIKDLSVPGSAGTCHSWQQENNQSCHRLTPGYV